MPARSSTSAQLLETPVNLFRDSADVNPASAPSAKDHLSFGASAPAAASATASTSTSSTAAAAAAAGASAPPSNRYEAVPQPNFVTNVHDIWRPDQRALAHNSRASLIDQWQRQSVLARARVRRRRFVHYLKPKVVQLLDHPLTFLLFFLLTFWALFMEDIRIASDFPKHVDRGFGCTSFVFMLIFFLEWAIRSWAESEEYLFSFFWLIDFVATTSMIFDSFGCFASDACVIGSAVAGFEAVVNSIRSTTRLARILRLLRVVRIVKLVAIWRERGERGKEGSEPEENDVSQSRLGRVLNDRIIRSVVLAVVVLFSVVHFLEHTSVDLGKKHGLSLLALSAFAASSTDSAAMLADYDGRLTTLHAADYYPVSLLNVQIANATLLFRDSAGVVYNASDYPDCFRDPRSLTSGCPEPIAGVRCDYLTSMEVGICSDSLAADSCRAVSIYDVREVLRADKRKGIVTQIVIAILLLGSFKLYASDVETMVVRPIESMIFMVRNIAANPKLQVLSRDRSKFETEAVRIALKKIVGLMQLGFGGAGHEIIAANLANADGQDLDLMRRGRKLECAYGFCDIRQFTDTVECLQDQVMLFTNSVGEIVHQACHVNRGEPNKNIGDAFLIVWRNPHPGSDNSATKITDGALTAFRRCVREIASSNTLKLVTDVPAIHEKFGKDQYKTKIGFGLHFGWSVEGPVGSPTKIDCSYLSPEVKISDRLEAATKIYSCNILMSGQFYDLLSDPIKRGVRLIDHATPKGSHRPIRIYADDRSNLWLKVNSRLIEIFGADDAYEQFSTVFHEGIDAFIRGDWPLAGAKLRSASDFCPEDVPTQRLLKAMERMSTTPGQLVAPKDWRGYHASDV
jgi:class 3 adenylate cyclase